MRKLQGFESVHDLVSGRRDIQGLTPKEPRIYRFKPTNSINHIVKNIIQIASSFISPKLVKNNACID